MIQAPHAGKPPLTDPEREAFETFYRLEGPRLVKFLLHLGASPADAVDAMHQACVELYLRWRSVQNPASYARRVARNELTTVAKRSGREDERAMRSGCGVSVEAIEDVYHRSDVQPVLRALAALPPRQREVVAFLYDGVEVDQIAEALGVKVSTVRSHRRHAKETLRLLGVGEDE